MGTDELFSTRSGCLISMDLHRSRHIRAGLRTALVLLGPLMGTGCMPESSVRTLDVWAVGPDRHVFPDSDPVWMSETWSETARRISLKAAIHETASFQLVLRSRDRSLGDVRIEITPPFGASHTFPAESITRYLEWSVPVRQFSGWFIRSDMMLPRRSEYPDALIPLDAPKLGEPFTLPPERSVPIWVDIHVAAGTPPGEYESEVRIVTGTGRLATVPLALTVWPFALPKSPEIKLVVGVDPKPLFREHLRQAGKPHVPDRLTGQDPLFDKATKLLDETMRLLRDHRCSPFLEGIYPVLTSPQSESMELDWTDYDRIVSGYLDGSSFSQKAGVQFWPFPIDASFPPPPSFGGIHSTLYAATVRSYLKHCLEHFEEKGWLDRHFVWIPTDSDSSPEGYATAKHTGRIVKYSDERLNNLCTMIPQDLAPLGWSGFEYTDLSDLVGTWAPRAQFFFPQQMDRERAVGKRTWFRPSYPPFSSSLSLESPPWQSAGLVWQAARLGAEAVFIPHGNAWPADLLNRDRTVPLGRRSLWLTYPGTICGLDRPIPSIRLKQLRRGVEDMAYRGLLARHRVPHIADRIIASLVRLAGAEASDQHFAEGALHAWVDEPELWETGRRLMGTELARLSIPSNEPRGEPIQKSLAWLHLFQKTENVYLDVAPARVRLAGPSAPGEFEVEFPVTISNFRNEPIRGTLRVPNASGKSGDQEFAMETVPPFGRLRTMLRARYEGIGTNEDGVMYETIEFNSPQAGKLLTEARIALQVARPIGKNPIKVDGDLSDWPADRSNVASDFLLVGRGGGVLRDNQTAGKPTQRTQAFVCRDQKYVYLGFNCFDDRPDQVTAEKSNLVRYDGLTPVGQDLIEIMLDPSNSGTTRSSDVYHIVIKPTGTGISEIGIATKPATGTHRFWPVDLRVGPVRKKKDRWVVEVRLPLSAFAESAFNNPVWGFNVARYQARLGEYASWSGASRHVYSPQSMGNLWIRSP